MRKLGQQVVVRMKTAAKQALGAFGGRLMTSWTVAAYALAAVLVTGIALCMWGVPLPLTDNLLLILDAQRTSLADGLRTAFLDRGVLRPFYWAHYKVLYELSAGRYYLAFQGVHVLLFAATVLLSVAALRVRSAAEWAGAATALLVLLGLHTFGNLLREQPILVVTCSALAFALAFAETPSRWRDGLAVVNLIVAMFIVEIGLLVWVVHAGAWLCGRRGVSRRALVALSAAFIAYFALRFLVLRAGAPTCSRAIPAMVSRCSEWTTWSARSAPSRSCCIPTT